uniref:Uncharacterized protein n=1 Tax=Aureoumbra lagunensis TaxID=44058 RepID=A0A7S3JRI0_9STRA
MKIKQLSFVVLRWTFLSLGLIVYTTREHWPYAVEIYFAEYAKLVKTTTAESNHTANASCSVVAEELTMDDEVNETVAADLAVAQKLHKSIREVHQGMSATIKKLSETHEENQQLWIELTAEVALLDILFKRHHWLFSQVSEAVDSLSSDHDNTKLIYQETRDSALTVEEEIHRGVQVAALLASTKTQVEIVNQSQAKEMRTQRELKEKDVKRLEAAVPREERELQLRVTRSSWANAERQPGTTAEGRLNVTALRLALLSHTKKIWIHSGWEHVRVQLAADWRAYLQKSYTLWKLRRARDWQWHRTNTPMLIEVERRLYSFNQACINHGIYLEVLFNIAMIIADQCLQLLSELKVCFLAVWNEIDQTFGLTEVIEACLFKFWTFLQSAFVKLLLLIEFVFIEIYVRIQNSPYTPPLIRSHADLFIYFFLALPFLIWLLRFFLFLPRRLLCSYIADLAWIGRTCYFFFGVILLWRLPRKFYRHILLPVCKEARQSFIILSSLSFFDLFNH